MFKQIIQMLNYFWFPDFDQVEDLPGQRFDFDTFCTVVFHNDLTFYQFKKAGRLIFDEV